MTEQQPEPKKDQVPAHATEEEKARLKDKNKDGIPPGVAWQSLPGMNFWMPPLIWFRRRVIRLRTVVIQAESCVCFQRTSTVSTLLWRRWWLSSCWRSLLIGVRVL